MHYRQRIRDAVAERLRAANTTAAANVFTSRARPVLEILQRREAVLSVYTGDENSERSPDGHLLNRTLTISIEGMAGGGDDLDNLLDVMAAQVEAAIDADPTLGFLLSEDMNLTATTSEISARGNQQVGAFRMDFEAKYLTQRITEQPGILPTQVFINPYPGPDAYHQVFEQPDSFPVESAQSVACDDVTCNMPAWQGDPP